jgi:glutamyl-tRNA reductase
MFCAEVPITAKLSLIGTSHKTAALSVRERFALTKTDIPLLYQKIRLQLGIAECLILNTCNRLEVYAVHQEESALANIQAAFCELRNIHTSHFEPHRFDLKGEAVVQHLFRVTGGIDSQIIGEPEILGQVKQAYQLAEDQAFVGPILSRMFQKSFQAAKWTRTHTGINQGQLTIGTIIADLATRVFGKLQSVKILIIGTGTVGASALHSLKNKGAQAISIISKNFENAVTLAKTVNAQALPFESITHALGDYDMILGATGSSNFILTTETLAPIVSQRSIKPLFLVDLAFPRDFEPSIAQLPNSYLYNLEDISKIANENLNLRKQQVQLSEAALLTKASAAWSHLHRRLQGIC